MTSRWLVIALPSFVSLLGSGYLFAVKLSPKVAKTCASADGLGCTELAMLIAALVTIIILGYGVTALLDREREDGSPYGTGFLAGLVISILCATLIMA